MNMTEFGQMHAEGAHGGGFIEPYPCDPGDGTGLVDQDGGSATPLEKVERRLADREGMKDDPVDGGVVYRRLLTPVRCASREEHEVLAGVYEILCDTREEARRRGIDEDEGQLVGEHHADSACALSAHTPGEGVGAGVSEFFCQRHHAIA